jgi:hypothetical protein
MPSECEPLAVWQVCLRCVGRWCLAAAITVAEFVTGGASSSDAPVAASRRKLYGYVFSHDLPSQFKSRARENLAWLGAGLFRLGTSDGQVLVSRSGWVVPAVVVGPPRRWLRWTLFVVRIEDECLTLIARTSATGGWLSE